MKKYSTLDIKCTNSTWVVKWLSGKRQDYCQCPFTCKIVVFHIESGQEYVRNVDQPNGNQV